MAMILNLKHFNEYGFSNETISHILSIFLKNCNNIIETFESQLVSGDYKAIKQTAHKLKGSCSSVGAEKMCNIAINIEKSPESLNNDLISNLKLSIEEFENEAKNLAH